MPKKRIRPMVSTTMDRDILALARAYCAEEGIALGEYFDELIRRDQRAKGNL